MDQALLTAEQQVPGWRTIAVRLPSTRDSSLSLTVDKRAAAQPQYRSTLTIDRKTSAITGTDGFESQNLGRRTRSWFRFVHTGEYYGLAGQTIAGFASLAGVVLVCTGFALSFQRFASWIKRRKRSSEEAELAAQEN